MGVEDKMSGAMSGVWDRMKDRKQRKSLTFLDVNLFFFDFLKRCDVVFK